MENNELIAWELKFNNSEAALNGNIEALRKRIVDLEVGFKDIREISEMLGESQAEFKALEALMHDKIAAFENSLKHIDSENATINQESLQCFEELGHEIETLSGNDYENAISALAEEDYKERRQKEYEEIEKLIESKCVAPKQAHSWKWQELTIIALCGFVALLAFKVFLGG